MILKTIELAFKFRYKRWSAFQHSFYRLLVTFSFHNLSFNTVNPALQPSKMAFSLSEVFNYYTSSNAESTSKPDHLELKDICGFQSYWTLLRSELRSKGCIRTVDCLDNNNYRKICHHEYGIAQEIIFGSINAEVLNHPELKNHNGDGLAVLLKLRFLVAYESENGYQLAVRWRSRMHDFPKILEEHPGDYDYYLSRYLWLVSRIGRFSKVGKYLTEKEITRHCLKSFLASKYTKPATKVLEKRGFSSKSFNKFEDMKTELISAIERSEQKRQWKLKRQQERALMPGIMEPEISDIDLKEQRRQLRLKRRQESVLRVGVKNGEMFCERIPVNPENTAVNKIHQESPLFETDSVPKISNANINTDQNPIVSRTMGMEANRESYSINKQTAYSIQDIAKAKAEKQSSLTEDSISQTEKTQAKKTSVVTIVVAAFSAVITAITSLFDQFHQVRSIRETPDTVYSNTLDYRAGSLLDHLDWLDSICIQFAPLSYQYAIVGKQNLNRHDDYIVKSSKVQANKTYDAVLDIEDASTSSIVDSEGEDVHLDSSSSKLPNTVYSGSPEYCANSLLNELDWLDSICVQFTAYAYI
ncbi:unnamed protein product [Ambrosiozyma monospora]|uniref:Unnamed protein product n=1 Tax=Ambrosiozyma monospora TaxID=43982 RepID=A0A9W7DCM8_AMBMO|nr:unnamed protein product [Ambrosiozyma monospora]